MAESKLRKGFFYLVLVLLTAGSLMSGVMKIIPVDQMAQNMLEMNYPVAFTRFIGLCWILGAVGLWKEKTRLLACLGMCAICFGAIAAHITVGHPLQQVTGATVYLVLALIIMTMEGFWEKIMKA